MWIVSRSFGRRVTRLRQTGMALLVQADIVRVAALVSWRSTSRIEGARVARPVVRTDCRTIAIRALTQAGRCELAVGEVAIAEVAQLASADRRQTRDEDKLFVRWKLHHLARCQQRPRGFLAARSEEHTSELQSLMRISYAVFWL